MNGNQIRPSAANAKRLAFPRFHRFCLKVETNPKLDRKTEWADVKHTQIAHTRQQKKYFC